jgi:catechol 2,3-dioxygenase-like lactoylglutathione lyase family enzyme
MKVESFGHVGLTVKNLEKALEFYVGVLGFEIHYPPELVTDENEGWCMLEKKGVTHRRCGIKIGGGCYIELMEYNEPSVIEPAAPLNTVGAVHISIKVDDIKAWYDKLSADGIHFTSEPLPYETEKGVAYWTMFKDPDGIQIEIMQNPKNK